MANTIIVAGAAAATLVILAYGVTHRSLRVSDPAGQPQRGGPEPPQPVAGELGKGRPEGAGEEGDPPGLPESDSKQEDAGKTEPEAPDQHQARISICCGPIPWETLQAVVNCLTGFILRHTMWAALH